MTVFAFQPRAMALSFLRWPPPNFAGVDATATVNGTVYFWWKGLLSWIDPFVNEWHSLDGPTSIVDAATEWGDPRTVLLFSGSQYWKFDLVLKRLVSKVGSPVNLAAEWFPLDAASYNSTANLVFFFKDLNYCTARFDGLSFSSISAQSTISSLTGLGTERKSLSFSFVI
jgi:hypothetical protein